MMDIHEILKKLPHRYPFLMVDRVIAIENRPVMPGVMMLEAMAQAAALLVFDTMGVSPDDKMVYYFAGIDGARFKRPVEPGDQLVMDVTMIRSKSGIFKFAGVTRVEGNLVCEAELMCTMRTIA